MIYSLPRLVISSLLIVVLPAMNVSAAVRYVDANGAGPTPPYISWATAATNIQDAVDAAVAGEEIVVTNGIYATGGRATVAGSSTNRVAVDKPLSLRSISGPLFTLIDGGESVRCVYLTNGASLSGFTLANGFTQDRGGGGGGGVWCESMQAVVSNCVVMRNASITFGFPANAPSGGGAYGGTLNGCILNDNIAEVIGVNGFQLIGSGGGAYGATLNNCTLSGNVTRGEGGGAFACTLNNCTLTGNRAYFYGGGARSCILNNCTLTRNSGPGVAGGAYACTLNNCALTSNSDFGAVDSTLNNCTLIDNSGGAIGGTLNNCIVYFNTERNYDRSTLNYSCTTPLPTNGVGNITNAPLFVDQASGNLRLQSNSPCINAGRNAFAAAGPDLDGNPRIVGGTVDIGAYEFQSLDLVGSGVVANQFGFNVTGQSNWVIVLEATSDFTNWTRLTTNTLSGSPFPFRDPTPPNLPRRFYRARQL